MLSKFKISLLFKILGAFITLFLITILIAWIALPGYLKDYIESNDIDWINREITVGEIKLNPFTLSVGVSNTTIKEPKSDTNFVYCENLKVNFDLWPLLDSKISTNEIVVTGFLGNVIQNGKQFNFSDLLKTKKTKKTTKKDKKENSEPIKFDLRNINITKSKINYSDTQLGSKLMLDSITINDQKFTSESIVFDADVALQQPEGGRLKGTVSYNLENSDYEVSVTAESWKLAPFKSYVTSAIHLSEFDGQLDANLNIAGNTNTDYIKSKGKVTVADFKLIDPESKPLINIGKVFVDITEINSQENIYDFKDVLVEDTFVSFEYLTNGDNFTKWLVTSDKDSLSTNDISEKNTASEYYVSPFELLSVYIYDMTREYIFKSYTAEKILFSNFNLKFYDYTLEDPFFMDLTEVNIEAKDIKPQNNYANFHIKGKVNGAGVIDGDVSVSRQGVENMTVNMDVKGLFLNRFSPYGRFYTAHRFLEGISSFSNESVIKDSYLTSTNKLHIEKIKVSKKEKTKSGHSLPMRLAVTLMKDIDGNVNLDIPIEGPINDPEYKFGKVIWQVVKNIFTKIATSPFKALSNAFNVNENDLKNIYFDNGQVGLSTLEKKPLDKIVSVLNKKKEIKIELNHLYNKEYEMDAIALKSTKVDYLKQSGLVLNKEVPIGKQAFDLSSTDAKYLEYLKSRSSSYDETISIPENARKLLGEEVVREQLKIVISKQKELIKNYLTIEKGITEDRFRINDGSTSEEAMNQSRPKFEVKFDVKE